MSEEYVKAKTGNVIKLSEKGDSVEGKYLGWEESAMYNKSYGIKLEIDGEPSVVFVSSIVTDLIATNQIKEGMKIKIVFEGKVPNKAGTHEYNDYSVYFKKE